MSLQIKHNKFDPIFEDDHILVIAKPSGIVVNVSDTSPDNTVQNHIEKHLEIDEEDTSEFARRAGIVHRLDKDTSGLLVIAKTPDSFYALKDQFKTRTVEKVYMAVVLGELKEKLITVKAPIARDPNNRLRQAVVKGGRFALTNFELISTFGLEDKRYSIVICKPLTGRTHQIRVHLSALGYPVVSDRIYLGEKRYRYTNEIFNRLMLHAWKLRFEHPKTKKELNFEAKLPLQFQQHLKT